MYKKILYSNLVYNVTFPCEITALTDIINKTNSVVDIHHIGL